MSPTLNLDDLYRDIAPEMARVEAEIRTSLADDEPAIAEMNTHASRYGGKRLRPAMALLVARCAGGVTPRHARLGAVVEMIHVATLVHDDVIDEAGLRRSQPTANARWGNYEAVLLGDIIFARAIHLLARLDDQRSLLALTTAVSRLCEGEIIQNRRSRDVDLSEEVYYRIIDAKTAELYATGCELAAHLSGASAEAVNGLRTFGREIGLAFQIIDDCLDIVGDEAVVGKSLGTDLSKGKITLPLILLRDRYGAEAGELLEAVVGRGEGTVDDVRRLGDLLRHHGMIDEAMNRGREHVAAGMAAATRVLPHSACAPLEAIGEFVLRRRL